MLIVENIIEFFKLQEPYVVKMVHSGVTLNHETTAEHCTIFPYKKKKKLMLKYKCKFCGK